MPKIIVDGEEIEARADANLLEVLLSNDIDIPYFCWHPAMGSVGACRQCAVTGYANEEVELNSGEILYIDNRIPITRSADQNEELKVVIEF